MRPVRPWPYHLLRKKKKGQRPRAKSYIPTCKSRSRSSMASSEDVIGDLPLQPFQPMHIVFPSRTFGKSAPVSRSFQATWFNKFKWLHYVVAQDAARCFTCCKAVKDGRAVATGVTERAFLEKGFTNWKDGTRSFSKHESCDFHKVCAAALASTVDVGDMLSRQAASEKRVNREYLLKVLSTVRFLARQGLALRGDGDEVDSNLHQLLVLRGEDYSAMSKFLERQQLKYTSPEVQNELLSIMALQILRNVAANIQTAVHYTVMVDETTDQSNKEQVVLVLRWVDEALDVHEEFIGLYATSSTTAESLVSIIKDTLLRMNLKIEHCRGQCYDGASAMSGAKKGVAKILTDVEPRAVYTHCYGHALNLGVSDCIKQCKVMKSALDVVVEISKLIKKSPKRDSSFEKLKSELAPETPGFRVLCPTRWTVRAASLKSVIDNYEVLLGVWEEAQSGRLDGEMKARIIGVETQMHTFNFLYGVFLGELILRHTDNLSKALQHKSLSAAEGQHLARLTLEVLRSLRDSDRFTTFYGLVVQEQSRFGISDPALPRKRRAPQRLEVGSSAGDFHLTPESHYRQIFFEAIDHAIQAIQDRFDQPGYAIYQNLEQLILKACTGKPYDAELQFVCDFYKEDLSKTQLEAQLPLLRHLVEGPQETSTHEVSVREITHVLGKLTVAEKVAFSGVCKVMQLLLVMPATNATSERSFSALRRVKTYLRTTMTQQRLNHLLVLHVHKTSTDRLDLMNAAREFVAGREGRLRVFGDCQ